MKKIMYMLFMMAIPAGSVTAQKAGYRASVRTNGWKDDNLYKSDEMPSYTNNAFYITISIGGGSFDKK